jgi:acetyl-CoA carboxylase biotin carboxylase subunit
MRRALDEFVIEGIKTTIPFHRQLMDDPRYIAGDYTTAFMDTFRLLQNKSIYVKIKNLTFQ